MALPSGVVVRPFRFPIFTDTGIDLWLLPGDYTFTVSLERAPDSAGAPDVANSVVIAEMIVPLLGSQFRDVLPLDNVRRWYRAQHIRQGWTAGNYTPWVSGVPVKLTTNDFPRPDPQIPDRLLAGDTRPLGTDSPIMPNSDFDHWKYY